MRLTLPLTKHNLYRLMRNQWKTARKRRVVETQSISVLKERNIEFIDANEYVKTPLPNFDFSTVVGLAPKPLLKDENHPMYKEQPCYIHHDGSVLMEGMQQALVLTNTVQLETDKLPEQIEALIDKVKLKDQDSLVKRCIKTSCLYDAEQKKLAIRKDPERPAWIFPRDYGITETRKNRMICNRLVHLCSLACPDISRQRMVFNDVPMSVPLYWEEDPLEFRMRSDVFISSEKPLPAIVSPSVAESCILPDLMVSHPVISLDESNFYEFKDIFPIKENAKYANVHTIMVHYNHQEVKNIYERNVEETQIHGRALLKAFTAAVAQARYNYGADVKDLPKPVVVQCLQTDGRRFDFSVFQLNTADLFSSIHNIYWSLPAMNLYENCSYVQGIPVLEGYNPQVFKHVLAFYNFN
ncbi:39S ribosomal protein L37, mitochondrial [Macrosteles quadrilineatus]|uniref:39S ribosomal protein L37, mitochondrial n=1 Tax=Macrosteles quadrilineatus TaxID=74068 RepID=UPI0023E1B3EE|nr:39S ribosomal protein L37, mitochondrial [Macrosteles quadrilineatus]